MKKIIILFLFVGCSVLGISDNTHIVNKQGKIDKIHQSLTEKKIAIDSLIRIKHPKLKKNAKNGIIRPDGISQSGNPIYYEKMHGRSQVEVLNGYKVKNNNILGIDLNGEGVEVHVWDWPGILKNHVEFVDPTTNTSIIETSSFERLKKLENDFGFKEAPIGQKTKKKITFFNLGNKNKWEIILSKEFSLKINQVFKNDLERWSYKLND